jgi:HEAT repeat protein
MPLFGPPNIEKLEARRDVNGLIKALRYPKDIKIRQRAAVALKKIGWQPGHDENAAWYWAIKHEWAKCIEIGEPAVEPLIAELKDDTLYGEQWKVAETLSKIGSPAVESLITVLKDNNLRGRHHAVIALGQIGDIRAVEPLIAALRDDNDYIRWNAARALGQIGDARAVEPLIAAFKDSDGYVRQCATEALGEIGDARTIKPLIAALKDNDKGVHNNATEALEKIGWQPGQDKSGARYWVAKQEWAKCIEIGAPAVESLITALDDVSWDVRKAAARALVAMYWGNKLDLASKQRILALRSKIVERHFEQHKDVTESCAMGPGQHLDYHSDHGIGVDFFL